MREHFVVLKKLKVKVGLNVRFAAYGLTTLGTGANIFVPVHSSKARAGN